MADDSEDAESDDREMGVEFGGLSDELESESYPVDSEELVEKYGDREVGVSDETETVEELLGPLNDTYEDAEGVRQAILNMVGDEAIGRKGYSDRTPPATGEDDDQESF